MTSTTTHVQDAEHDHADDVAAIREVIADVETGFNTNDVELSIRNFAADASAVAVTGALVVGTDELRAAHVAGFAGPLSDQYARYEVADITFVRPDVALVHKLARATDAGGVPTGVGHQMIALYVMVREDDRWWIASRQNTLVPA